MGTYWYFTAYFCMYFFIPFLNFLLDNLEKKMMDKLIILIFTLFCVLPTFILRDIFATKEGFSPLWLGSLYLIGGYIKKYSIGVTISKKKLLLVYITCATISWLSQLVWDYFSTNYLGKSVSDTFLMKYTSPTILLSGIMLLLIFANLKVVHVKFVKFFAPASFGVYLIHEEPLIRKYFILEKFSSFASYNPLYMILLSIITAVSIWFIGSLIDRIRIWLFNMFRVKELCMKIEQRISNKMKYIL